MSNEAIYTVLFTAGSTAAVAGVFSILTIIHTSTKDSLRDMYIQAYYPLYKLLLPYIDGEINLLQGDVYVIKEKALFILSTSNGTYPPHLYRATIELEESNFPEYSEYIKDCYNRCIRRLRIKEPYELYGNQKRIATIAIIALSLICLLSGIGFLLFLKSSHYILGGICFEALLISSALLILTVWMRL